jgi:intraflagellar transport protein 140
VTPNPKAVAEIDEKDFDKEEEQLYTGKTCETFFVTTDYGIKKQDAINFEGGYETLLGVQVPYFYYMGRKVDNEESESEEEDPKKEEETSKMLILRNAMKDFTGLENVDEVTKKAIMNFSHYLTVGNMDEAYNSVRNINNKTVW